MRNKIIITILQAARVPGRLGNHLLGIQLGKGMGDSMKNPLDTLQGTVASGLVILVVMVVLIQAIAG